MCYIICCQLTGQREGCSTNTEMEYPGVLGLAFTQNLDLEDQTDQALGSYHLFLLSNHIQKPAKYHSFLKLQFKAKMSHNNYPPNSFAKYFISAPLNCKFVLFQLGKVSMFQFVLQVQQTSLTFAAAKEHGSGWLASKGIWQIVATG